MKLNGDDPTPRRPHLRRDPFGTSWREIRYPPSRQQRIARLIRRSLRWIGIALVLFFIWLSLWVVIPALDWHYQPGGPLAPTTNR